MESSENRAGFLGMLLLELAVFVLWFRLCFGKVEFDKASSVFRCSVIWCCDSRPGSICVVWVCLLLSSILGRQQEALLVLYSSCSRVVWVWCFFFLLLLFIILMASMCIAPIYIWNWRALASLNTEADELVSYTTPSEGLWETENVLCVWVGDALKAYREDVTYCCLTT